jgi:adenine deaminase
LPKHRALQLNEPHPRLKSNTIDVSENLEKRKLKSWAEAAPRLVAVAAGREPADLVVKNCKLVNVQTREILLGWQVAVTEGRFAYVGPDASHCIGPATRCEDGGGRYLIPGLCDGHMHIESGMLTPAEFAAAVIPHGTTTMFTDPHEIANVLGLDGVRMMHDEALLQPINIYTQMPSCAPSAPGLETTGFEITPAHVAEAMAWPGIIGLGEMMNYPGVIAGDTKMLAEIAATMQAGKVVGGHYAALDRGVAFHAYAAGGPADDHEGTAEADAILRARGDHAKGPRSAKFYFMHG